MGEGTNDTRPYYYLGKINYDTKLSWFDFKLVLRKLEGLLFSEVVFFISR